MANKHEFDVRGFSFVVLFCILVIAIMQTTFLSTAFVERWAYENARFQRSAQVLLTMPPQKIVPYNLTLGFVGDIMLDRGVKGAIQNYGSGDYRFPFAMVRDELRQYDILFGNLG